MTETDDEYSFLPSLRRQEPQQELEEFWGSCSVQHCDELMNGMEASRREEEDEFHHFNNQEDQQQQLQGGGSDSPLAPGSPQEQQQPQLLKGNTHFILGYKIDTYTLKLEFSQRINVAVLEGGSLKASSSGPKRMRNQHTYIFVVAGRKLRAQIFATCATVMGYFANEEDRQRILYMIVRYIRSCPGAVPLPYSFEVTSTSISMVKATGDVHRPINLRLAVSSLSQRYPKNVTFDADRYAAIKVKHFLPFTTVSVFHTGKFQIWARSVAENANAFQTIVGHIEGSVSPA